MLCGVLRGHVTGQDDGGARRSDADLLVGENMVHLFRRSCHVDVDPQIEAAGALQFIPDQQGNLARREAVYQYLGWSNDQSVGHRRIRNRDSLEALGRVDQE